MNKEEATYVLALPAMDLNAEGRKKLRNLRKAARQAIRAAGGKAGPGRG